VDVYSARGQPVAQWLSLGRDALLTSLAVAGTNVFVADAGQRVVWRLDSAGNVLGKIDGKAGNTAGFVIPSPYFDIAVGPGNELWVVDPGRHNVICYAFDGGRQSQWGRGGSEPEGFCGCCNPSHIAILPNGSFATSEKGLVRVKVYTAKGELTGVLAGPEAFDEEEVGLDLAADSEGRIYVLEPKRNRIRVFEVGR
jgi:DNA-binding beta-propeller fold protein YncE